MGKLKTIRYPTENNDFIYVPKRAIDLINKKTIIINQYVEGNKLVIKYESKKGNIHGVMELYDMGPDITKKSKEESLI